MKQNFKIALVGVEFEENLSLRYLAGALIEAGYSQAHVRAYNSLREAEDIAVFLTREQFDLVGISMAFQVRAIEDMALVQLLRQQGFNGHITAGGQFATLHYNEIFADCGLDSIIRFEAEAAIVELATALSAGGGLESVTGLVWRDSSKQIRLNHAHASPSDINSLPWPLRRQTRTEVLGLKTVHMVGSRGCHATCSYCCVSALATERREAAKEGGGSAIPGTRRRTAANVASEIAMLYFKYDIRIFEFQDDNWIHPKVSVAVHYFRELKQELDKRGVGQIGLTLKMRADSVQPEILEVLKAIGLIRVFVGIESGTQSLLSKLGRRSQDERSLRALEVLREYKIPAYFNALLFGPDIRFEELEPELEFLDRCTDFPFEIVEVVIYGKTGLYLSLKQENRLFGNYLDYDYAYLDQATQDTHQLISALETRHFGVYSPVKMAADLGFNLGVLQVFYPGTFTEVMSQRVAEMNRRINTDQLHIIRKAASKATREMDIALATEELISESLPADLQFYREIIALQQEMEQHVRSATHNPSVQAYYRAGAIVQSGLIAGLFLLLSGEAGAQERPAADQALQKSLVELMYTSDSRSWKKAEEELMKARVPLSTYLQSTARAIDSINRANPRASRARANENYQKLLKTSQAISRQRIKQDYERLNKILLEHQPKIKIASTLRFSLNENGKVEHVALIGADGYPQPLSPSLEKPLIDLLAEKRFYTYEANGTLSKEQADNKSPKIRRTQSYKRQRRGPLD